MKQVVKAPRTVEMMKTIKQEGLWIFLQNEVQSQQKPSSEEIPASVVEQEFVKVSEKFTTNIQFFQFGNRLINRQILVHDTDEIFYFC